MDHLYIPKIARGEYDAFRGILRSAIPETYSDWLDQVDRWRKHYASENESLIEVPVSAAELNEYLLRKALPQNLSQFCGFAEWVAKGRPD